MAEIVLRHTIDRMAVIDLEAAYRAMSPGLDIDDIEEFEDMLYTNVEPILKILANHKEETGELPSYVTSSSFVEYV